MATLTETGRKHIARKNFAYVDKEGGEHLPIHDEEHVRNAIARFNQTAFESVAAKEKARRKVLAAAKKHGIEVAQDDEVAKAAGPLKRVRTKRGMRGGKKVLRKKTARAKKSTRARRRS
jgi:TRAP-type C4-dicarboxylate transport system substrate-binding protein